MTRRLAPAAGVAVIFALLYGAPVAGGQEPPPPEAAPAPPPPPLTAPGGPRAVAPGGRLAVRLDGLGPGARVEVRRGDRWRSAGEPVATDPGVVRFRAPRRGGALRVRGRTIDGRVSPTRTIRVRSLVLAAVGDVNLGDTPGAAMRANGYGYPWASVGPLLRRSDIAVANLECAVSLRGTPQSKQYVFRGHPRAVRAMRRRAGIDVVNLANNHVGDYGDRALLDTLRTTRAAGITAVGAGASEAAAYRPQIVERLGLRVAFVGFSVILPFEFRALGASPGTAWAFPERVTRGIRRARRDADVVVAMFHWGTERAGTENPQQRALAGVALAAGADAVLGAHPHVLQPIRRPPGKVVAYSLGNFVFNASSAGTASTGILRLGLGRRDVRTVRLIRATIRATRPILR